MVDVDNGGNVQTMLRNHRLDRQGRVLSSVNVPIWMSTAGGTALDVLGDGEAVAMYAGEPYGADGGRHPDPRSNSRSPLETPPTPRTPGVTRRLSTRRQLGLVASHRVC
ncbi:MAG: hypothetical protein K0V04_11350 [Deltaproteobacteria bacterium]|nr:hypothetical protein [Deltaproteobacteria bacterium]